MGGLKDEAHSITPLFPLLRVNDTEKGRRSKPPSRIRVALYEQLTVPSPSHSYDSPSTCAAGNCERNLFAPFCNIASPSNSVDKLKSASHGITTSNAAVGSTDGKMTEVLNYPSLEGSSSSATKLNSFEQNDLYEFKNFSFKNLSNSCYLKVPVIGRSDTDLCCGKDPLASADSSLQLNTSSRKAMEEAAALDEKSRETLRNQSDDNVMIQSQDCPNPLQRHKSLKRHQAPRIQEIRSKTEDALNEIAFTDNHLLECLGNVGEQSSWKVRTQSSRKSLVGFNNESTKRNETIQGHEQPVGIYRHDDISDCSIMDSATGLSASPDDLVKVTGDKQFWKIRTVIINQQRTFAEQLFELYRLITVQKMLARSPDLLLEPATAKQSSPVHELAPKVKPNSEKLKPATEFSDEHIIPKLPLPSITKQLATHQPSPAVVTSKKPSSPWLFPAPGNQWLVPVMSPSEGLVYKPYAGPCSPTSGLMAPIHGNDLFNTAFRFPASHQFSHSYFPPYAPPVQSAFMTGPVVELVNPFAHAQSSCSMSSQISQSVPCCLRKPEASKDSEMQGSTASSPPERPKRDVLPLFPTEPSHSNAETCEHKAQTPLRAIKAVPHNPLSALESAARIFRSIQEERKHNNNRIS